MEQRIYLGIDVGSKGFLTLHLGNEFEFISIEDNDYYKLSSIMQELKIQYPNVVCVMEDVHALFGSSAKSTFSFGEINGLLKGLLISNNIPYHLVPPKKWQNEIWQHSDIEVSYKKIIKKDKEVLQNKINTKQTSINAAKRLFPNVDFRRTDRCKKIDDNKVDSLLIAEYGRRKNL